MVAFTDFLAKNYLWFLVISIVLLFSLIGYFVDQNEQKKGISKIIKEEKEKDIHDLAKSAENKSLNSAINDIGKKETLYTTSNDNVIFDTTKNETLNSQVGFDVLNK